MCNGDRETINHCLVDCSFAKVVWERTGIGTLTAGDVSFSNWSGQMTQRCKEEERRRLAMVCWAIWKERNEVVWQRWGY